MYRSLLLTVVLALVSAGSPLRAACMNKYVHQKSGQKVTFTLLTGMLTFDEAKAVAAEIAEGSRNPIRWMNVDGKVVARNFGPIRVVRPMPVSCEGKGSGVVLQAVFPTGNTPDRQIQMDFGRDLVVEFEAQSE